MRILVLWLRKFFDTNIVTFVSSFNLPQSLFGISAAGVLIASLTCCSETASAGFDRISQPTKVFGNGSSSLFDGNAESLLLNPSASAFLQSTLFSAFYSPSPFDLPQLSNGGMLVAAPYGSFVLSAAVTTFGFSLYRELTATATVGKPFNGIFFAGVNFNYNHLEIARYGSRSTIGIDIGATVQASDEVRWGISLLNINRPAIGDVRDELPQSYLTGISYEFLPGSNISVDMLKDVRYPTSARFGIQCSPVSILEIRCAVSNEPSRYFAGIGIRVSLFSVDYGIATHTELGLTHSFGISFQQ